MICPKCGGKLKTVDTLPNSVDQAVYRRKRCLECKHLIYTEEVEVDYEVIRNECIESRHMKKRGKKNGPG